MKRRAFLATVGASVGVSALTGCIANSAGNGDPSTTDTTTTGGTTDDTTTDRTTTTRDPGVHMDASQVELDSLPEGIDASVDVSVLRDVAESHPAVVEVAVTNTADDERTWQFGPIVPWSTLYGEQTDGDRSVLLAPGGADHAVVPPAPQEDACWRATDGIVLTQVIKTVTFEPGETKSATFAFLAGPESDCLAAGTYRFEDNNFLGETQWGFELTFTNVVEHGGT